MEIKCINNEKGSAAALVLAVMALLTLVPMLTISAGDNQNTQALQISGLENMRTVEQNFAAVTFAAVKSQYTCTQNLSAMGKIGRPISSLNKLEFRPHLLIDDGPSLQPTDFITGVSSLRPFLGKLQLQSSKLEFYQTRSPTTVIYKMKMNFLGPDNNNVIGKPAELFMLVEVDGSQNIQRCQLSKYVYTDNKTLIEDALCKTLSGPTKTFEMKGSTCI